MRDRSRVLELLADLSRAHRYSLIRYIVEASPFGADPERMALLRQISDMQEATADRMDALILERDGPMPVGDFPLRYAAYHDLALEYLWPTLQAHLAELEGRLREAVPVARADGVVAALIEEALGEAIAHREMMEGAVEKASGEARSVAT